MGNICRVARFILSLSLVMGWFGQAAAQTSSRGPRKGPAPGEPWGKQTFPAPVHARTPASKTPESPGKSVPQNPERWRWVLTNKVGGAPISTGKVPVYGDDGALLGALDAGTEVKLDLVSARGKRLFYAVPWNQVEGASGASKGRLGWVEGNLIELAGPR